MYALAIGVTPISRHLVAPHVRAAGAHDVISTRTFELPVAGPDETVRELPDGETAWLNSRQWRSDGAAPQKLDDVYPGQIEFDNPELSQAHRSHQVVPRLPSFSLSARMTAEPPRPQPTGVCAGFRSHREMNTTPR